MAMRRYGTVGKNSNIVAIDTVEVKVHTFRRTLDPEAVRILVAVYTLHTFEYVEISYFFGKYMPGVTTGRGGLFPRLRWWGLIEVKRDNAGEEIQGMWRVTKLGEEFVKGAVKLCRFVDERRSEVVRKPYGPEYGIARFVGWPYTFEKAKTGIERLAGEGENVLGFFETQWRTRGAK